MTEIIAHIPMKLKEWKKKIYSLLFLKVDLHPSCHNLLTHTSCFGFFRLYPKDCHFLATLFYIYFVFSSLWFLFGVCFAWTLSFCWYSRRLEDRCEITLMNYLLAGETRHSFLDWLSRVNKAANGWALKPLSSLLISRSSMRLRQPASSSHASRPEHSSPQPYHSSPSRTSLLSLRQEAYQTHIQLQTLAPESVLVPAWIISERKDIEYEVLSLRVSFSVKDKTDQWLPRSRTPYTRSHFSLFLFSRLFGFLKRVFILKII